MAVLHIFAQANVSDNQQLGQFLLEQAHGLLDDAIGGIGAGSFGIFAMWNTEEQNRGHAKFMSPGRLAQEFVRVAGLGDMECAGGDEENVVGADHAVARVDGGSFNDGENVALYTFARDVGAVATLAAGNLVDFIEEDDAV